MAILKTVFVHPVRFIIAMHKLFNRPRSYFMKVGYLSTILTKVPKDTNGDYLPWMNYAVIDFLSKKLNKSLHLFEYGSGFSTIYFSKRTASVTSVEYNKSWYDKVLDLIKEHTNAKVHYYPLDDGYISAIQKIDASKKYDVIIIDGRKRVHCALNSYPSLKDNGVLLVDDTHRAYYQDIFDFYTQKGYNQITFTGMKPTGTEYEATTLFYKTGNNCLGI
ncbi:hypothetical protein [Leptobacterium sp. I13]|uniref:hypothetical protein n=1 Tax=Leptobacterium meishanense TaxID=3128904 RepID=UPI0030ECCCFC